MGHAEIKVIDVTDWEFIRLHQEVLDLKRLGWCVVCARDAGGDAGTLHLVLRREAGRAWG